MQYGIITLSMVPLRAEPKEQSEMTSQILFGECVKVLGSKKNWINIINLFDGYQGWTDINSVLPLREFMVRRILENSKSFLSQSWINIFHSKSRYAQIIPGGSSIPYFNNKRSFRIAGNKYRFQGNPTFFDTDDKRKNIEGLGSQYINTPYLWGGRTIMGIDCSGFSQIIFKMLHIQIPRDASQQVSLGHSVDFVNEAKAGDLAFFDNDDGDIIHVGIILNEGRIIHASGNVRIDRIDHFGIHNLSTGKYSHKLRVIKNIIDFPPEKQDFLTEKTLF